MLQTFTQNAPSVVVDLVRLCVWLALLAAVFVPLERLFALRPGKLWREGTGADLGYYFLGGLVVSMFLGVPLGVMAWIAHRLLPYPMQTAFDGVPFWPRALAALVADWVSAATFAVMPSATARPEGSSAPELMRDPEESC